MSRSQELMMRIRIVKVLQIDHIQRMFLLQKADPAASTKLDRRSELCKLQTPFFVLAPNTKRTLRLSQNSSSVQERGEPKLS